MRTHGVRKKLLESIASFFKPLDLGTLRATGTGKSRRLEAEVLLGYRDKRNTTILGRLNERVKAEDHLYLPGDAGVPAEGRDIPGNRARW